MNSLELGSDFIVHKLLVRVSANSSQEKCKRIEFGVVRCYVHQPPIDGRANKAVIKLLSDTFKVPSSSIVIESGCTTREKRVALFFLKSDANFFAFFNIEEQKKLF